MIPTMDFVSLMCQYCKCMRQDLSRLISLLWFRSGWGRCSGARNRGRVHWSGDEEIEKSSNAVITRPLVLLSRDALARVDYGTCERNRALLKHAFDDCMYQFKGGSFLCPSMVVPQFCECCFAPLFCQHCYHPKQRDGSPASHIVPFYLRRGDGADSLSHFGKWVLFRIIHVRFPSHPHVIFCCSQS